MPVTERRHLNPEAMKAMALLFHNRYMFTAFFWKADLTIPEERVDLPEAWRGKQILTTEQRMVMLDNSKKILLCTSRKTGKSLLGIEARFLHEAVTRPEKKGSVHEGLLFTPREHQMKPILGRLITRIKRVSFFDTMCQSINRSDGTIRFPRVEWFARIAGSSNTGENFIGLRAAVSVGDEGAYFPRTAWTELLNTFMPMSPRIFAGVPNGVRGTPFWELDQTNAGRDWSRHRFPITANPLYHSMQALLEEAMKHGGTTTQGFQTQVMGRWGEEASSSFSVIPVEDIPFNQRNVTGRQLSTQESRVSASAFKNAVGFRIDPEEGWHDFILGFDVGLTASPTEAIIVGLRNNTWIERARITLRHTDTTQIAYFIDAINMHILPRRAGLICVDAHGVGSGVISTIHSDKELLSHDDYTGKVYDVGFVTTVSEESEGVHKVCGQQVRQAEQGWWICDKCNKLVTSEEVKISHVGMKQHLTENLKDAFSNGQYWLDAGKPEDSKMNMPRIVVAMGDEDTILELGSTTEVKTETGHVRYISLQGGGGHVTDAWRSVMSAILAYGDFDNKTEIERPATLEEYGWANAGYSDGSSPWEVVSA